MRCRRALTTLAVGVGVLAPSLGPLSDTAISTVSGPSWQGYGWHTASRGGVRIVRSPTALTFRLTAVPAADPIGLYYTGCKIRGDFTAQVDYRLSLWPNANGVRVGLLVNNPAYPRRADSDTTERTSFGAADSVGNGESYVQNGNSSGGPLVVLPTTVMHGSLRVRKAGRVITSLYRDPTTSGLFVVMADPASGHPAKAPAYTGAVSLGLQVWSGVSLYTGPATVRLSRFRITRGTCA